MQDDKNGTVALEKAGNISPCGAKSILQRTLEGCCAVLLGGIVVLLAAQVVVRHMGWGSLLWSSEMATWLFSWSAFLGAVLVFMEKKHIIIDILTSYLSPRLLKILDHCHQVVILAVLIVLAFSGVKVAALYANQTATSIEISMAYLFAALPVACSLMIGWTVYGWIKARATQC